MEKLSFKKFDKILREKTIILGIGNIMRGDDGVGPILISRLKGNTKADLLDCGEVPENYTQPIIEAGPDNIVIVDATDWNGLVGEKRLIEVEEIHNVSPSTHNSSLQIFINYLKKHLPNTDVIIIGIQPKRTSFLDSLSPEVERTVDELLYLLSASPSTV